VDAVGRLYFTMRMVRGSTLEDVLQLARDGQGAWSPTRVLGALLKACEAVAFAHDKGVVHRDLKPSNIMVGGFGEVYVVDWGLARVLGRAEAPRKGKSADSEPVHSDRQDLGGGDSTLRTGAGEVVGTPAYMSPEQAGGAHATLDERSDVFSMGAILYHLLAGHRPYADEPNLGDARAVTLAAARRPPTPIERLAPDASDELLAICRKATAREKVERYATMLELAEDLRAYLENRVVSAHRTDVATRIAKWIGRNRALFFTALAATVVIAVGLGLFAWRLQREIDARAVVQRSADRVNHRLRARDLIARAEELYPAAPRMVRAMETWVEDAGALMQAWDAARAELEGDGDPAAVEALRAALADLAPVRKQVHERLESARTLEQRSLRDSAIEWERMREQIASSPEYARDGGPLRIEPQLGLVPLGIDAKSGLGEFFVLGSGEPPRRAGERWRVEESTGIVLVLVPGDEAFELAREEAGVDVRCRVRLHPYLLGKHEVTQGQFLRVMGLNRSFCSPEVGRRGVAPTHLLTDRFDLRYPVETVSWFEADRCARRLELRLPFEAQHEFAARARTATPFWSGDDLESLVGRENLRYSPEGNGEDQGDEYRDTSPVGTFDPNPFGLFDIAGNVREWCRDPTLDSLGPDRLDRGDGAREHASLAVTKSNTVIVRGNSAYETPEPADGSARHQSHPDLWSVAIGFRVSRPLWPCPRCPEGSAAHE